MHSAEPLDPRSVNPATPPAPASEAWRAEVASRLHSYRARRKKNGGESLALDFESAADGMAIGDANGAAAAQGWDGATVTEAERDAAEAHAAFDTNYYRRLNARGIEQSAGSKSAAATVTSATAAAVRIAEPEWEASREPADDEIVPAGPQQGGTKLEIGLEIDLQLHAPAAGDARLERYCIQGAESEASREQADASPLPDSPAISCEAMLGKAAAVEAEPQAAGAAAAMQSNATQSNLIAFPRPLLEPPLLPLPSRDELAEPVHARPRILEVPEDIMPAVQGSLFPEIRLDGDEPELCGSREPEIAVPLQVAPVSIRLTAALADLVVVLAAAGLFAAIAERALPDVPHAKPFWMGMGAVTVLFWAVYQNLFLLYAGRTIGMSMYGIHLSTFDGRAPQWDERRRRAIFTIISFVSVALGFLWALVDEDALCWHDRVSQTFPTRD